MAQSASSLCFKSALSEPRKTGQRIRPERFQELAQLDQPVRIERVEPPIACWPIHDETGVLEDLEMLADRRTRDRHVPGDLDDREWTEFEPLDDTSARSIPE